jgi:hypothetical protein
MRLRTAVIDLGSCFRSCRAVTIRTKAEPSWRRQSAEDCGMWVDGAMPGIRESGAGERTALCRVRGSLLLILDPGLILDPAVLRQER